MNKAETTLFVLKSRNHINKVYVYIIYIAVLVHVSTDMKEDEPKRDDYKIYTFYHFLRFLPVTINYHTTPQWRARNRAVQGISHTI